MVSKLPEWRCAGGKVWESEVGFSTSLGFLYLLLLTHVHLQPDLSNFLTTSRIMAIVVTAAHAKTPLKKKELNSNKQRVIHQKYHYN